jgi:hypothetical protein
MYDRNHIDRLPSAAEVAFNQERASMRVRDVCSCLLALAINFAIIATVCYAAIRFTAWLLHAGTH